MTRPIPTPEEILAIRKDLGLTTSEFADALGFGNDGARTVRALEAGTRHGHPYHMSGQTTAALVYLLAIDAAIGDFESGMASPSEALMKLKQVLPERLRR